MTEQELREKIVFCVKKAISNNITFASMGIAEIDCNDFDHIAEQSANALIAAGIGDVKAMKEIKYRVRRAEKALYIACRETAEIIFKDDFDRHAQEYMYGYLKQAEKELVEEKKK